MARVHVGERDLSKSFYRHRSAAVCVEGASRLLLQFYAVECGMKARYLRERGLHSTEKIEADAFGDDGHDLSRGLRSLKTPAADLGPCPHLRRSTASAPRVAPHQAHQAWRYGAAVNKQDEDAYAKWLERLRAWLEVS